MVISNLTEQQKRNSILQDLDKNIFTQAGAGAGKTTLIVERIVRQIMAGIKAERIVVITFTNMATRELQGRILAALRKRLDDSSVSQEEKDLLKEALQSLDRMQISTIHGFCHRILTEKSFEVGLPVSFELMDPEEEESLFDSFFAKWVEKNLKKSDWEKLEVTAEWWSSAFNMLKGLSRTLANLSPDMKIVVPGKDADPVQLAADMAAHIKEIEAELDKVAALIPMYQCSFRTMPEEDLNKNGKAIQKALLAGDDTETVKALMGEGGKTAYVLSVSKSKLETYQQGLGIYKTKKAANDKAKEVLDEIKLEEAGLRQFVEARKAVLSKLYGSRRAILYAPYVELAEQCVKDYRAIFPADRVTNDMLIYKTLQLLKENPEVRDFFAEKFDCYYVDEFQDTDHKQAEFIWLLAQEKDGSGKLRDGALFVVGDPKQSIYRFRGAEPEVYFDVKDRMAALGNALVHELQDNYRSDKSIIDWVNQTFASKSLVANPAQKAKAEQEGAAQEGADAGRTNGYQAMNVGNSLPDPAISDEQKDKLICGVYKYLNSEKKGTTIEEDAKAVCIFMNNLVKKGYLIKEKQKGENGGADRMVLREIRYSDFLMLCDSKKKMSIYADAMRDSGIPYIMIGESILDNNYYVKALIRIYAFLADPFDAASRQGALEVLRVSGAENEEKNRKILDTLWKLTSGYSAYGCLQYLTDHKELYLKKDKPTDLFEVRDFERKLNQLKEKVLSTEWGSREELLLAMREYAGEELKRELVMEEDPDAVRYMNLHQAKGLEGNIVIWTTRVENRSFRPGDYRCGLDYYPAVFRNNKKNTQYIWGAYEADQTARENAEAEDNCETTRLEYVAATRAKQALIFMDMLNKKGRCLFGTDYGLESLPSIEPYLKDPVTIEKKEAEEYSLISMEAEFAEEKTAAAQGRSLYTLESPSDYEDESAGKSGDTPGSEETSAEQRPSGNILGNVMHRSFELLVERLGQAGGVGKAEPEESLIRTCVAQARNESINDIPEGREKAYFDFVCNALEVFEKWTHSREEFQKAKKVYTEWPFSFAYEAGEESRVWLHGEADLVLELEDGSFVVFDYKSDDDKKYPDEESFAARLRGKYTPQVAAYRKAVSTLFDLQEAKIRAFLLSFSLKERQDGEKLRMRVTEIE